MSAQGSYTSEVGNRARSLEGYGCDVWLCTIIQLMTMIIIYVYLSIYI